jgi:hypothetical protein
MRIESAIPALIALLLTDCGDKEIVFSSRTSPNGSMVAENVLVDHGGPANGGTSHLIIRNAHAKSYDEVLDESAPDLFIRWVDERHLEVWREGALCDPPMPEMMGDVHIACKSYDPFTRRPGISAETIAVPAGNVSVLFEQRPIKNGTSCVLSIETAHDPSYDSAKVEITVGVSNSCKGDRDRPCGGISTRFSLSDHHSTAPQAMLTSVTVADIPAYTNRLPEGGEGTMIRGQFLEQNAVALIEHLKRPSIQIEYSRNFFDQVLKYDVPLTGQAKALGEFDACVGDADLLWVRHGR